MTFNFDNSYFELNNQLNITQKHTTLPEPLLEQLPEKKPEPLLEQLPATPVDKPSVICINDELAQELGLDTAWLHTQPALNVLSGNEPPTGSEPFATVYAGHQFGQFNPKLGDGRALILGEHVQPNGKRVDIQLKGSGPTPYSRGGDGRSPLGPVLREYIVSEAMHALGVPTTRSLAAISTGETVWRNTALPGAVLTRVASSHLRIGTLQYFSAKQQWTTLRALVDYVLERHFSDNATHTTSDENSINFTQPPAVALIKQVCKKQAELIAQWQSIGFIHGVMNTDNMLLCGETIDYGPCAFMDAFDPATVFSSIDHQGRYAYQNQPAIAHWNLSVLADALIPIIDDNQDEAIQLAQAALDEFPHCYLSAYYRLMSEKLGFNVQSNADSSVKIDHLQHKPIIEQLLADMQKCDADFTLTFYALNELVTMPAGADLTIKEINDTLQIHLDSSIYQWPEALLPWFKQWREALNDDASGLTATQRQLQMRRVNPALIPRNHLIEKAIQSATVNSDYQDFYALVDALKDPHVSLSTADAKIMDMAKPPKPNEQVLQTFCGT